MERAALLAETPLVTAEALGLPATPGPTATAPGAARAAATLEGRDGHRRAAASRRGPRRDRLGNRAGRRQAGDTPGAPPVPDREARPPGWSAPGPAGRARRRCSSASGSAAAPPPPGSPPRRPAPGSGAGSRSCAPSCCLRRTATSCPTSPGPSRSSFRRWAELRGTRRGAWPMGSGRGLRARADRGCPVAGRPTPPWRSGGRASAPGPPPPTALAVQITYPREPGPGEPGWGISLGDPRRGQVPGLCRTQGAVAARRAGHDPGERRPAAPALERRFESSALGRPRSLARRAELPARRARAPGSGAARPR